MITGENVDDMPVGVKILWCVVADFDGEENTFKAVLVVPMLCGSSWIKFGPEGVGRLIWLWPSHTFRLDRHASHFPQFFHGNPQFLAVSRYTYGLASCHL